MTMFGSKSLIKLTPFKNIVMLSSLQPTFTLARSPSMNASFAEEKFHLQVTKFRIKHIHSMALLKIELLNFRFEATERRENFYQTVSEI